MMKLVVGWTMSCMLATAAFSPLTSRRRPRPRRKMMILPSSSAAFLEDYGFEQNHRPSLPDSEYNPILISDQSLQTIAIRLRSQYDEHFQDPRQPNENRFVWDPWFVRVGDGKAAGDGNVGTDNDDDDDNDKMMMMMMPGELEATRSQIQYSLKRIPASRLFATNDDDGDDDNNNDDLYETLIDDLTDLAASIGLTAMTPPWVSLYLEGDLQNFHTDAPHGPMAFVLSLSKEGDFSGGETILLNHQTVLDYWRGFNATKGLECGSIVRFIPPTPTGRCIVFDPRIPHGVNRVTGTQDPRKGRIAIHGWFDEPSVCWFGPWNKEEEDNTEGDTIHKLLLDSTLESIVETLGSGDIGRIMGYLAVKLVVDVDGDVEDVLAVCDTLQADPEDFRGIIGYDEADNPVYEDAVSDVRLTIMEALQGLEFEGSSGTEEEEKEGKRAVVVPFLFE